MRHVSEGNEVTPAGIVHRCSCGWVSRACFSNAVASNLGADHREAHQQGEPYPDNLRPRDPGYIPSIDG